LTSGAPEHGALSVISRLTSGAPEHGAVSVIRRDNGAEAIHEVAVIGRGQAAPRNKAGFGDEAQDGGEFWASLGLVTARGFVP
jgi:hypothetical protein